MISLNLVGMLNRKIGRLLAVKDAIDVVARRKYGRQFGAIGHKPPAVAKARYG